MSASPPFDLEDVLSGRDPSGRARLLRALTRLAEPFYATGMQLRNLAYSRGWRKCVPLGRPVISVGNITTGGTGKTPTAIYLVEKLREIGRNPAVLMRGYGADRTGLNDEARLLLEALGSDVPLGVNPDRVAAAANLLQHAPETDVFVLDDGFQHRRVARNLDLVLVDATNPFGYDHVIPRGLLREPMRNLRRADAVIVTRAEQLPDPAAADALERRIIALHGKPPLAWFEHRWIDIVDMAGDRVAKHAPANGRHRPRVLAFCGIGRPEPFFNEAQRWFDVVETRTFADHHIYTYHQLSELKYEAEQLNAAALLTTEKDWTKISELNNDEHELNAEVWNGFDIYRPHLTLHVAKGEADLLNLIRQAIA